MVEKSRAVRKAKEICKNSIRDMRTIFPAFFVATLISVMLDFFIPEELVYAVLGENPVLSIVLATVLGIILPIPRYATYPIALSLLQKGATIGTIFALISGEVIIGSPDRDVMEFSYFGWKSFVLRGTLCTIFVIIGSLIVEAIL
ncbi:hypothetical protein DRO55_06390 [Candidatus Bathyarchaeota archaeon]|nr:MAG: hypothetical protein DRO55_06390 [Candidatus Bathyarchaeota archaeon]